MNHIDLHSTSLNVFSYLIIIGQFQDLLLVYYLSAWLWIIQIKIVHIMEHLVWSICPNLCLWNLISKTSFTWCSGWISDSYHVWRNTTHQGSHLHALLKKNFSWKRSNSSDPAVKHMWRDINHLHVLEM